MAYLNRSLENEILSVSENTAVLLLIGPRQSGKTTMLQYLMENTCRRYIDLENPETLRSVIEDPELFLEMNPAPLYIDEIQIAPNLLSLILETYLNNENKECSYWFTASRMTDSLESVISKYHDKKDLFSVLHMAPLSQSEIYGGTESGPFIPIAEDIEKRMSLRIPCSASETYKRIWNGQMPARMSGRFKSLDVYYSAFLQALLSKDIYEAIPGVDKLLFSAFMCAAACRIGQILNIHEIAEEVGISDDTSKRWFDLLVNCGTIFFLDPYSSEISSRAIKAPKIYFFDTGLVAYLTKYMTPEILMCGALSSAILENYVISEIRKSLLNDQRDFKLMHYRDKDSKEIDLVLKIGADLYPILIRKNIILRKKPGNDSTKLPIYKAPGGSGLSSKSLLIICLRDTPQISGNNILLPVWVI